jgi:hypothetical protein
MLSGAWPALPMADPYTESITRPDFDRLLAGISASRQQIIFVDSPQSLENDDSDKLVIPGALKFYEYMRSYLIRFFRPLGDSAGWQVWQRR